MNNHPDLSDDVLQLIKSKGYFVGTEVNQALYWAGRVAKNLAAAAKYESMRLKLQFTIWQRARVVSVGDLAIDREGAKELSLWIKANVSKLSDQQMVDGRQFVVAVEKLNELISKQAD